MAGIKKSATAVGPCVRQRGEFAVGDFIVYSPHGVGRIIDIEEYKYKGVKVEVFVIRFEREGLILRVPKHTLSSVGIRQLSSKSVVREVIKTLKGPARINSTRPSRRREQYVAKMDSGDLVSISEVVRDLYNPAPQTEQCYSECQLYEEALDRLAWELAVVEDLHLRDALRRIADALANSCQA